MLLIFLLTLAARAVKSMLPEVIWERVGEYSYNQELDSLSKVSRRVNEGCKDEMRRRKSKDEQRVAEKAQLVNELEGYRTKTAHRFVRDFIS